MGLLVSEVTTPTSALCWAWTPGVGVKNSDMSGSLGRTVSGVLESASERELRMILVSWPWRLGVRLRPMTVQLMPWMPVWVTRLGSRLPWILWWHLLQARTLSTACGMEVSER